MIDSASRLHMSIDHVSRLLHFGFLDSSLCDIGCVLAAGVPLSIGFPLVAYIQHANFHFFGHVARLQLIFL
jgi:hypothetical protein